MKRRSFLAAAGAAAGSAFATGSAFAAGKPVVGVELFSVRNELAKDLEGTLKEVAKIGYEGVEFFGPYFSWTPERTKEVRKLLDDLKLKCLSTHNGANVFTAENIGKAIELNTILGSKFVVMASAGRVQNLDGWKKVVESLNMGHEKLKSAKMAAGFHNHQSEWKEVEGTKPIELIAQGTPKDFVLQLDVGTTVETGNDPVAWIEKNKGRLRSIHLKEFSKDPAKGYKVLFGEGDAPWKAIFKAAEKVGGVEHYLIEQEGASVPPFEAIAACLANFKKTRG